MHRNASKRGGLLYFRHNLSIQPIKDTIGRVYRGSCSPYRKRRLKRKEEHWRRGKNASGTEGKGRDGKGGRERVRRAGGEEKQHFSV